MICLRRLSCIRHIEGCGKGREGKGREGKGGRCIPCISCWLIDTPLRRCLAFHALSGCRCGSQPRILPPVCESFEEALRRRPWYLRTHQPNRPFEGDSLAQCLDHARA